MPYDFERKAHWPTAEEIEALRSMAEATRPYTPEEALREAKVDSAYLASSTEEPWGDLRLVEEQPRENPEGKE